jgi:hypothetical protein
MFRSLSYDHHQGSITVPVQLPFIGVHASSYSGLWLYVVGASVRMMYLSVWCLVMYSIEYTFHLFLGLASGFFPLSFLTIHISSFPCPCRMIRPAHPSPFDHPNNVQ